jgi:hypothetical protein
MVMTFELYETMCAYFDGKLTLEEEKKFLEKIDSDPELRKEFEWEEQLIYKVAQQEREIAIIASDAGYMADGVYEEKEACKPIHKLRPAYYKYKWAIAAAVIGMIITTTLLITNRQKPTGKTIEWTNGKWRFPPYNPIKDSPVISPSKLQDLNRLIAKAEKEKKRKEEITKTGKHLPNPAIEPIETAMIQQNYAQGKAKENIEETAKKITSRGGDDEKEKIEAYVRFYRGLSFLELNNDSGAIRTLTPLLQKKDQFAELVLEAKWNIGKAHYKRGDKKTALAIFQELIATNGFMFKEEAQKLIKMIKTDKD